MLVRMGLDKAQCCVAEQEAQRRAGRRASCVVRAWCVFDLRSNPPITRPPYHTPGKMPGGRKDAMRVLQGATLVLESLLREVSES